MIEQYIYKSLDFEWGKYGSDIGYILTKQILSRYEIEKGLVICVRVHMSDQRGVKYIEITIIDSENRYDKELLRGLFINRLGGVIKMDIGEDLIYKIENGEELGRIIKEYGLEKNFVRKDLEK